MNVEDIKPTNKIDKSKAVAQSTTTTYSDSDTTYSSTTQTYGGSDRAQDLGPVMLDVDENISKNRLVASIIPKGRTVEDIKPINLEVIDL